MHDNENIAIFVNKIAEHLPEGKQIYSEEGGIGWYRPAAEMIYSAKKKKKRNTKKFGDQHMSHIVTESQSNICRDQV